MIPIRDLLARIRWDPAFGQGRFEIAYLDHRRKELVRVPLERIEAWAGARFAFDFVDEEGVAHSIPYHRVREVTRDRHVIWSRPAPKAAVRGAAKAVMLAPRRVANRPARSRRNRPGGL